jgi:perosamine synthetase
MYKRKISLYFGSITLRRSFQAIGVWLTAFLKSSTSQRNELHQLIKEVYCPSSTGVFSFGSGRSSLTACLKAAGIGLDDEVLLSAYTCLAVPTGVIAAGAKPVYIDINPNTLNAESHTIFTSLSPRVKAIVVQHTLGKPAQVKAIVEQARERGILVIEDCALSLGSKANEQYVGTFADAAILSMELSKTLSAGWGGILIVNNQQLAKDVEQLYSTLNEPSWWSSTRDLWQTVISTWCHHPLFPPFLEKYVFYAGFKSHFFRPSTPKPEFEGIISDYFLVKMGGIQAALAVLQWGDFFKIVSACEQNARTLRGALSRLRFLAPGSPEHNECSVAPRISMLVTDRELVIDYFRDRGIELGVWFDGPLSPVPENAVFNYQAGSYPLAEQVAKQVVNLPCHSRLTRNDLQYITLLLEKFSHEHPGCVIEQ